MASADILLELDGIKGESADPAHSETMEVDGFVQCIANSASQGTGGGAGKGKAVVSGLKFTAPYSGACPELEYHCFSHLHIPKAVVYCRKKGAGETQEYHVITMTDCVVQGYVETHSGGNHKVSFTLAYATKTVEYKPQKDDQTLGSAVKTGFSVKTGQKV